MNSSVDDVLSRFHRDEHSRLMAVLVRRFGDLDLAEEAAQEAMEAALVSWPATGVPANPLAWLITAAKRKALDRIRRDAVLARRLAELCIEQGRAPPSCPPQRTPPWRPGSYRTTAWPCCSAAATPPSVRRTGSR